ncbi:MAG: hypothetical protein WC856_25840 [Methylococcaceae bacterium]|jgi:hypothetical protein
MKKIKAFLLLVTLMITSSSWAFNAVPEFDGGYIITSSEKIINVKEVQSYTTKLVEGESVQIMALLNQPSLYYIIDKTSTVKLKQNQLKGFAIKGKYKFDDFSLHPLLSKDVSKLGFFENKGPGGKNKPFYHPGNKLELQSKSTGMDSYYYQSKEPLSKGDYVAWLHKSFWLFTIE